MTDETSAEDEELDLASALYTLEELESESHRLWDQAFGDAVNHHAPGGIAAAQATTYRATAIHAQAMNLVRKLQRQLRGAQ